MSMHKFRKRRKRTWDKEEQKRPKSGENTDTKRWDETWI